MTDLTASSANVDRFRIVYSIFYVLGLGTLLPWNFFIAVSEYWMVKFRNVSNASSNPIVPVSDGNSPSSLSPLQIQWGSNLSIASMIPNVTFLLLNAVFGHHFKAIPRIIGALISIIILFVFTDAMTLVETDSWQTQFLTLTLFTVVVINIMVAIVQGGLTGLAARFPPAYMGAVVQGQALGGIFAAATNVLILALGYDHVTTAFYCFFIAILFLVFTLVSFVFMCRTPFYQYYTDKVTDELTERPNENVISEEIQESFMVENSRRVNDSKDDSKNQVDLFQITIIISVYATAVFTCFLVTLAVFPSLTMLIKSVETENLTAWHTTYFHAVGCFLLFNVGDYVGRILAGIVPWPSRHGDWLALILSLVRISFIPLFLICNASPENRSVTPVLINSDAMYLLFMCLFSVSNGFLGNVCMMYAPKKLSDGVQQSSAASIMVSILVLGLAVGAGISGLILKLL